VLLAGHEAVSGLAPRGVVHMVGDEVAINKGDDGWVRERTRSRKEFSLGVSRSYRWSPQMGGRHQREEGHDNGRSRDGLDGARFSLRYGSPRIRTQLHALS
jgi:hypothetical protein